MSGLVETVARAIAEAEPIEAADLDAPSWMSWTAEAEAAIRATLARMRDDVRDHTLYRRTVEHITADFAKRHGLETPDGS